MKFEKVNGHPPCLGNPISTELCIPVIILTIKVDKPSRWILKEIFKLFAFKESQIARFTKTFVLVGLFGWETCASPQFIQKSDSRPHSERKENSRDLIEKFLARSLVYK